MSIHRPSAWKRAIAAGLFLVSAVATTGCITTIGPNMGPFAIPIPISPWLQEKQEDEFWEHERYGRAPILPPLTSATADVGMDPPPDDQVFRKLQDILESEGNWPFMYEVQINDVRIVKEKIADYIDPPRVFPLIGAAQVHHVNYKCTVYYQLVKRVGWPVPHTLVDDSVEVIYIDKTHFHRVGNENSPPPNP
ncbi:MAG: hypothetical protein WD030_01155 [Pirellulales bacterium]